MASALMKVGGEVALQVVQSASIVLGLPFSILSLFIMQCILLFCKKAAETEERDLQFTRGRDFTTPLYGGIFNIVEYVFSLGQVHPDRVQKGMHLPSQMHVAEFLRGTFLPYWSLYQSLSVVYPNDTRLNILSILTYTVLQYIYIGILAVLPLFPELRGLAWAFFVLSATFLAYLRNSFREHYDIGGDWLRDFMACLVLWPQVLMQMRELTIEEEYMATRTSSLSDEEGPESSSLRQDDHYDV
jgi:hypothetical protein